MVTLTIKATHSSIIRLQTQHTVARYINLYLCTHQHRGLWHFTFNAGGSGSSGASNLPWETGTLDGLRALLNLILITAAMDGHNLTCPLLHLVRN